MPFTSLNSTSILSAEENERPFIHKIVKSNITNAVMAKIPTLNDGDIYNNQIKLFNEYFDEYSKYKIIDKDKFYIDKNLFKEDVYIKEDFYYLLSRDELDKITTLISIYNDESLEVVGNISIKLNNTEIGNLDIYRNKKKKQLSFFQRIKNYLLDIL